MVIIEVHGLVTAAPAFAQAELTGAAL